MNQTQIKKKKRQYLYEEILEELKYPDALNHSIERKDQDPVEQSM